MSADTHHNVYDFPECHSVIICGDIHGDFNLLVNKVCVQYQRKMHRYTHNSVDDERLSPNYYWPDEAPVFAKEILSEITSQHKVDTVVTHPAPSFCELQNKSGLLQWAIGDENLLDDVQKERETMDAVYEILKTGIQPSLAAAQAAVEE